MRRITYVTILVLGLVLATSPIGAKYKNKGVETSLREMLVLMDLSPSATNNTKVYIDEEGCQCVCDNEQWSCVDNTNCDMQADACLNDELSYDKLPWQVDDPIT